MLLPISLVMSEAPPPPPPPPAPAPAPPHLSPSTSVKSSPAHWAKQTSTAFKTIEQQLREASMGLDMPITLAYSAGEPAQGQLQDGPQ